MGLRRLFLGLCVVALIIGGTVALVESIPARGDAALTLIAPPGGLPPPYDFAGVRSALRGRGTTLSAPTTAEIEDAKMSPNAFLARLPAIVAGSYPGDAAQVVSVHLAIVDTIDPRFTVTRRLSYVVETTGHATGNCFTLYDASTAGQFLAACFFSDRSRPH